MWNGLRMDSLPRVRQLVIRSMARSASVVHSTCRPTPAQSPIINTGHGYINGRQLMIKNARMLCIQPCVTSRKLIHTVRRLAYTNTSLSYYGVQPNSCSSDNWRKHWHSSPSTTKYHTGSFQTESGGQREHPRGGSCWKAVSTGVVVSLIFVYGLALLRTEWKSLTAAEVVTSENDKVSKRMANNFIADVVEQVAPSVVFIETMGQQVSGFKMGKAKSAGSGFIVRSNGLIMTNAHLVTNDRDVKVRFRDGTTVLGRVICTDEYTDLALIKVHRTNLPVLTLGESSKVRVGEFVAALGSPLSLSNTVTAGIVSCVRASKELGLSKDINYIQTDALINVGNSGGPLVNLDGEVVGINTMKIVPGISFAIPSDNVKEFLGRAEKLADKGHFPSGDEDRKTGAVRRYLGLSALSIHPEIADVMRSRYADFPPDVDRGVFVYRVTVPSPAYQAGIQPGDAIISVNGKPIQGNSDFFQALKDYDRLEITLKRGASTVRLVVYPQTKD